RQHELYANKRLIRVILRFPSANDNFSGRAGRKNFNSLQSFRLQDIIKKQTKTGYTREEAIEFIFGDIINVAF
ncbi:MAG: hypothetical protein ACRCZO_00535, partial [Cetobacterium sp.]